MPDPISVALLLCIGMIAGALLYAAVSYVLRQGAVNRRVAGRPQGLRVLGALPALADPAEQLRAVSGAAFQPRPILSVPEAEMLHAAEDAIRKAGLPWRVMAQVSLGEILASADRRAFAAINAKRVDLLIVTASGEPLAAIECVEGGHSHIAATARAAVKCEALQRAGIRYIEITPSQGTQEMETAVRSLMQRRKEDVELAVEVARTPRVA